MNNNKFVINQCNVSKKDTTLDMLSVPILKKRSSLSRRKSLRLLKDARIIFRNITHNTRKNYIGDRIMAHRAYMNFSQSEDILNCRSNNENGNLYEDLSVPSLIQRTMLPSCGRLLKLSSKHKSPSYEDKLKMLYDKNEFSSGTKSNRHISAHPERILDAPKLSKVYWNILDWNNKGILCVALSNKVYFWQTGGKVRELVNDSNINENISCVKWLDDEKNHILAVGSSTGRLGLWTETKLYKTIDNNSNVRITAITSKKSILSVGYFSGLIQHYNIDNITSLGSIEYHEKAIKQMRWSVNHSYLAVASEDGSISVWPSNQLIAEPMTVFRENDFGIDDMAWSPKHENILLFAGGTDNSLLKFMDVKTKTCIKSLNCNCRMSYLFWSDYFNEIAVVTNESNDINHIRLYNDTSMKMVIEMMGHKGEIISMISNPENGTLATIGGDESLRLWACFHNDSQKKSNIKKTNKLSFLDGFDRIR